MVEAGLAFQCGLAARRAVLRQGDGEQRVAHRAALAQRAAAAARAFEIAGREVDALRDRAVDLVGVEAAAILAAATAAPKIPNTGPA